MPADSGKFLLKMDIFQPFSPLAFSAFGARECVTAGHPLGEFGAMGRQRGKAEGPGLSFGVGSAEA